MSQIVYIGGTKGGTTKTTTAHLLSLGAILKGHAAAYVLTDPHRELKTDGRPYAVIDGRNAESLAHLISIMKHTPGGWIFIDGGGNRPAFDIELASEADLCLLPFRASEEDVETVSKDLRTLPNSFAWPSAWPTNKFAQKSARYHFINNLENDFKGRIITNPIYFVNSISELLDIKLYSPSTVVRNAARRTFDIMQTSLRLEFNNE